MLSYLKLFLVPVLCLIGSTDSVQAQQSGEDKEIIIIEKTIDSKGNVISKSTKRYNGKYTEKEIQELIDEDDAPMEGNYDLEGLGFGENLNGLFDITSRRPTIGVNILFDNGTATVEKVNPGSGAYKADIRSGDQIISIDGVAISSIEDVYEILDTKSSGNEVTLVIFRDGSELEKEVVLGSGTASGMFFNFPEEGGSPLFGDIFSFDLDSLFQGLKLDEGIYEMPQMKPKADNFNNERPSLGIFIDDERPEIVVAEVIKDSPAERAGLKKGDIVLRMDDNIVTSFREVKAIMNTKRIGDQLVIEYERNNKTSEIKVQLD